MCCKFQVILFLILLLSTQKAFIANAEHDYSESIQLWVEIDSSMNYRVIVIFSFSGLSRPLNLYDFQSEPSFLNLGINVQYFVDGGSTRVTIGLNESKVSTNQGRFIADMMTRKLEQAFGIPTLSYAEPNVFSPGYLYYTYEKNYTSIEFRDIFLDSLPSQGFRQVLASMLPKGQNYTLDIGLGKEGDWFDKLWFGGENIKLVPDQEQTISLKEITGYSGRIGSASTVSSTLYISINSQLGKDYSLIVNPVSPTQMLGGYRDQNPQYDYSYDVTGSSVEDFSISLKVVSSSIVATALIILAMIVTAIISIIIIKRYKK